MGERTCALFMPGNFDLVPGQDTVPKHGDLVPDARSPLSEDGRLGELFCAVLHNYGRIQLQANTND